MLCAVLEKHESYEIKQRARVDAVIPVKHLEALDQTNFPTSELRRRHAQACAS
jgi:hypothetical protein